MPEDIRLRSARSGDGADLFDVTRSAVVGLASAHYSDAVIENWMGDRTPEYYERLIPGARLVVAERDARIMGFVEAVPGELTRLFVRPEAAGHGLGARLIKVGIELAASGWDGPILLESTLNARRFYERHGFVTDRPGIYSHGLGGAPIDILHMSLSPSARPVEPRSVPDILTTP